MDCGTPFCHKGQILKGMTSGCPINNLIPEWNDLVYRGMWQEAYERLSKTNNFPEFTGLVCPAPCEAACTLGIIAPPVTIKNIEMAIIEKAFDEGWVSPNLPKQFTGKRIAIVGSGPAGLACADQLNRVGHQVTVFERSDRIGGLLMYGIPNMKLDKGIVQRRVDLMAASGIVFLTNQEVGRDVLPEDLRANFDAVVLCTGATQPRDLNVPGRRLPGIYFAVEFLHKNTKALLDSQSGNDNASAQGNGTGSIQLPAVAHNPPISASGKDVIVIGGGDTGTDCVATALRQGCRSLIQFEILPQPPLQRAADNPWPEWPRVHKLDYGQAEAEALFGADPRNYCVLTKEFMGDDQGQVQAVKTVQVQWHSNGHGRQELHEVAGSQKTWPAQLVLLAMGFTGPENELLHKLGVAQDSRANVDAPYGHFQTSIPGIFAAGDNRRGQSLVVWAIHEGRSAAREVDRWLMGKTDLP